MPSIRTRARLSPTMTKKAKNTRRQTHKKATTAWRDPFLNYLRRGWTVAQACRNAGVAHRVAYDHREKDETFGADWDDELQEGTDILEGEAIRRGFQGYLKPVYQQGRRVGTIREYSDTMASLILKKRNPAFKERHEHSGKDGGAIIVRIDGNDAKF